MKYVKIIFLLVIGLYALSFFGAFYISTNFRLSHVQYINAKPEAIYDQIINIENWKNWYYLSTIDPDIKMSYSDIKSGKGATLSWYSDINDVGRGSLNIKESTPDSYVLVGLEVNNVDKGDISEFILKPKGEGTEVKMGYNSWTEDFVSKWTSRLFEKPKMEKALITTLENLDKYLEKHPYNGPSHIQPADTQIVNKIQ